MSMLAIDGALKHSGISYRRNDDIIFYTLDFKGSDVVYELSELYRHFALLKEKEDITHIIREGLAFGYANWACTRLSEVSGVVRAAMYPIPIVDVAPKTVKKIITGKGTASKQDVMIAIQELLGIETTNDNEADAIAIMLIGEAYMELCECNNWIYGVKKISECSIDIAASIRGKH